MNRLHDALKPILRPLRPVISPLIERGPKRRLDQAISIADLRECARRRMHPMAFAYLDAGADDEVSLRRNKDAYTEFELHYHVLAGNRSPLDLSTSLLGHRFSLPFFNAPAAANRLFHTEGEVAVAAAANAHKMLYSLSSFSTCTFDQISAVHTGPKIFQLYVWKDRAFLRDLLSRARENGFELLALTADLSWFGNRERERKAGFTIPPAYTVRQCADALTSPAWSFDFLSSDAYTYALIDGSARADSISSFVNAQIDAGFNWADAEWLCAEWGGPVLLKGVVRPDNAKHAIQSGFAGVWVSNHGGRQLETAPAPIQVLPAIRYALGPTPWVVMDGGVQRGVDIAKAIALGADGVAVGKPALYGLGGGGENGVRKAFSILSEELERAMGLLGVGTVDELKRQGPSLVVRRPSGVSARGGPDKGGCGAF